MQVLRDCFYNGYSKDISLSNTYSHNQTLKDLCIRANTNNFNHPVATPSLHHGLNMKKWIGRYNLKNLITIVLWLSFNDWHSPCLRLAMSHANNDEKKMFILFPSHGMWHSRCSRTIDKRWRSGETGSYTVVNVSGKGKTRRKKNKYK